MPQPEWPMIETNSPLSTVSETSLQHLGAGAAAFEGLVDEFEREIALGHGVASPQALAVPRVTSAADERDDAVEDEADDADIDERHDDVADAATSSRRPR